MKNKICLFITVFLTFSSSCSESFLEVTPQGVTSVNAFYTEEGIDALLLGAYSLIDGTTGGSGAWAWSGTVSNWVWGSVASDDAYKGSESGDQADIEPIERYETLPTNTYVLYKWETNYDGVVRANDVVFALDYAVADGSISEERANEYKAEALFLRAWHHFELKRVFNNIPYIDENVTDPGKVSNTIDAWPFIEKDLKYAVKYLPESQRDVGRPTQYAAEAVLARVYLFQQKYSDAKPLLDDILQSGKFELAHSFHDNFRISTNNNKESIFEIQFAVNDGAEKSFNGNYGEALNFAAGLSEGSTCCGFHSPSQNLVNAFKVDTDGLPLQDSFNETNLKNDMGLRSSDLFIPTTDPIDPRLDWTVSRRGIPYLDWYIMRGYDFIRVQAFGGPYLPLKNFYEVDDYKVYTTTSGWALGVNSNNYRAYRLAHIILWRAEVAVEENDLNTALTLVNQIRERAGNVVVMGRPQSYILAGEEDGKIIDKDQPSANYIVNPYPSFPDQEYARKAVRFEERLEFATEGMRFFDLVRWGIADQVINDFIEQDIHFRSFMTGTHFEKGKNEYWPIPQSEIDLTGADILVQNPGY